MPASIEDILKSMLDVTLEEANEDVACCLLLGSIEMQLSCTGLLFRDQSSLRPQSKSCVIKEYCTTLSGSTATSKSI